MSKPVAIGVLLALFMLSTLRLDVLVVCSGLALLLQYRKEIKEIYETYYN